MPDRAPAETVFTNGLIVSHPGATDAGPHGMTVVAGGRLQEVNAPPDASRFASAQVVDCTGCLLMPGLINLHVHSPMSLLRGVADDLPLDTWLHRYIFPSESAYVSPDFVRLGSLLSAAEMALSGTAMFADGYFYMEQAAEAAMEIGLRAFVGQGILDVPAPDAREAGSWEKRIRAFLDACPRDELIRPALFCHSPYLCGPETLARAYDIARNDGRLLFCHVAETAWEVQEIRARYGRDPVAHLEHTGVLGEGFIAVHAVHVSEHERDLLASTGTGVVHCPESNMKLASGAAPIADLVRRGVRVALGTDGAASNNNLDMFEEMRSASLLAKVTTGDPEALSARNVLQMATIDAAKMLGMDHLVGTLEPGKLADVAVVDLDKPHLTPVYDPVSHLVYSARGSDVRDLMVNGRFVVRNGRLTTIDLGHVMAQAGELATKIAAGLSNQHRGV
jgi:5-methylthioadenosine/S-adenosylhomocysteine deaminase